MGRPLWRGSIAFGLVNIPIELHTAVRNHRPKFRLLHAKDNSPVRFERVCIRDGTPVAWDELVKGFEFEKGRFVVLTKDDFKSAALENTRTIDIIDFVRAEEIDDRFFETPFYVLPAKGGDRAYALLREAIRESGRIGVAKFILRDAQHLAGVEVVGDAIVLSVMRFADELADIETMTFPSAAGVRANELTMARTLVENLAAEWDPEKYTDEYRDNLKKVIQAKLKGRHITLAAKPEPRQAEVVDLMERLRKSLAQSSAAKPAKKRAATRKRVAGKRGRHAA